jgi:hypothetical protein
VILHNQTIANFKTKLQRTICLVFAGLLASQVACHASTYPSVGDLGRARFSWEAVANQSVTGYKVYWGTSSGVYNHTVDAGNMTSVIIGDFSEGVQYFSAITAYSATGEESNFSTELSFTYDTTDRVVLLEAENGVLTPPMQVFSNASTSWVAAPNVDPNATATFNFEVPYTVDYYVWCRVLAPSVTNDSFLVTVDQGSEEIYNVYGTTSPSPGVIQPNWTWSRIQVSPGVARAYALEAGTHSIRFRCLENTLLDRVVIVCNPDFIPTDALPSSGDFVGVVDHPQSGYVALGGSVTLSATFVSTGPVTFQWLHNGSEIPEAIGSSITISSAQDTAAGEYKLRALQNTATTSTRPGVLRVLSAGINPAFRVRNMSSAAGGVLTFEVEGALGSQLDVYTSSDLVSWELLITQTITGNTLTVTDPGAIGATKRFYRLADNGTF